MSVLVVLATFLAAGVEWVEALTIVLAVGITRGWRGAFAGMAGAFVALLALVAIFGAALTANIPLALARTAVGVFLLLFGLRWLHKAILRSSGLKALHDEAAAFEETKESLAVPEPPGQLDWVGATTSFNGVFLEGLEVVFIVIALGGLQGLQAATAGALGALAVVAILGVALRSPLTRIPENAMKYTVGIMLTAFGTFFAGEGVGVAWWYSDASILGLIVVYALVSLAFVALLRAQPSIELGSSAPVRVVRAVVREVWGLFVDDGALAIVAIAALLAVAVFADHVAGQRGLAGALLAAGMVLALWVPLSSQLRRAKKPAPAAQPAPEPEAVPAEAPP
jgi:uncharacterized membrane protein